MPHVGGYLASKFVQEPILAGQLSWGVLSWYGEVAASSEETLASGASGIYRMMPFFMSDDTQMEAMYELPIATGQWYTLIGVKNTDAGAAHDGGWYIRRFNTV